MTDSVFNGVAGDVISPSHHALPGRRRTLDGASMTPPVPTQPSLEPGRVPVVIHADDPVLRAGIVHCLTPCPTVELVDDGDARYETVAVFPVDTPDEAVKARLRACGQVEAGRAVLVTRTLMDADFLDVMGAGVRVIVRSHDVSPGRLVRAVTTAAAGHGDLPEDLVGRLLLHAASMRQTATGRRAEGPASRPSPRELAVLRHISEGFSNREIADRLACSEWAVGRSLRQVMDRWGVRSREHATAYAIQAGHI
ncbi:response regulator transcription factor [Streptomyces sp. NPDC004250]|uniref:helix-turn-helix transcriptional regulator n=1 Tax=Streptomyces sp. NPDC004250 TaxID=3364692 RepID=UPI003694AD1F